MCMLLDRSSRGGMAPCRSRRDSRREGRALREVCHRLMSRRFKGTTKCRSRHGGFHGRSFSNYHLAAELRGDKMAFARCDGGVQMEKAV